MKVAGLLSLVALGALLCSGGVAQAGGGLRGYVLMPGQGRVAIVDMDLGHVISSVSVPAGGGPIAASIDGSRVLAANTRLGQVTEIDGLHARRIRTFSGLGRPVDLAFVSDNRFGLVRPRYAVVADARGAVFVIDLLAGNVVRRIPVLRPSALLIENGRLWVTSAGATRVAQFDLGVPARPRRLGIADAQIVSSMLAPFATSSAAGVDLVSPSGKLVRLDGYSLARTIVAKVAGRFTQLLGGYDGEIWAATSNGRVLGVGSADGRVLHVMRVPRGSRLGIVGGWLAAVHGSQLRMFALGTDRAPKTIRLPGTGSNAAFAIV